uniref:Uncharacterized protein n=1 Tax=Haemophilus influenzae TaxID=727 RepID=A0AB37B4B9_HAEIF|nr:hypothetical protein BV056_00551 [Haemophilus influenzae]
MLVPVFWVKVWFAIIVKLASAAIPLFTISASTVKLPSPPTFVTLVASAVVIVTSVPAFKAVSIVVFKIVTSLLLPVIVIGVGELLTPAD